MFKWKSELFYLTKYAGAGVFSTIVGFLVIFLLLWFGFTPIKANFSGYLVGLILGFLMSRKVVFRSQGNITVEVFRYLLAFIVSYLFNIIVLYIALYEFYLNQYIAQIVAAIVYTVGMYLLARLFVYNLSSSKG